MTIAVPTLANLGLGSPKVKVYSGGNSDDDDDVLLTLDALGFDELIFGSATGAVDVLVSLDGTNFLTSPLAFESLVSTTPATRVVVTAANIPYLIKGRYAKVRFLQNGATAVDNFTVVAVQR